VAQRLIEHGLATGTPVAVIENGTRPEQKVITARLDELAGRLQDAGIAGPALIIIGEVARRALEADLAVELQNAAAALPHALAV
jgi:uroporphyrin-III C-methyltransferase/precorrin-2 dehydrogenase/sirohydrochlorin ferrochelatase